MGSIPHQVLAILLGSLPKVPGNARQSHADQSISSASLSRERGGGVQAVVAK